tara:strand:- start:941 stop:1177 length:237 start_codon:yes stop_codon:yes gene_type:complete
MTKTETVKRGYHLKFAEDLTPDEVSALGKRLEFHITFMAMNMIHSPENRDNRMKYVQDQATKILEIAQAMKDKGEYQI